MKKVLAIVLALCLLLGLSSIALADAPKPTKVVLDKEKTVVLNIDETLQLNAALQPEGAESTLKWSTSSKKIATVKDGLVTPVKEGTATIAVKTANGKKDTVKVKVVDPYKPTKVVLDKSGTVTLNMGEMLQLSAALQPDTAKTTLKWSTSSKKIATVKDGLVTPVKEGTATITVKTANGKKDTVKVKVVDPYKPSKIVLSDSGTITLNMGETLELSYALYPETARTELKWKSSSKKIALVDDKDGIVTPVKEGTATITVTTANGKKDTVKVKVVDPYKPTKVTLGISSLKLQQGESQQLTAALEPATAKTTLTWKSSNTKIATVDGMGNVACLRPGSATISVKTANGKTAKVKLTVSKVLREDEKIVRDVMNALGDDLISKAKKKGYEVWFQFSGYPGKGIDWQVVVESPANTTYPKYKADLELMQQMYKAIVDADVFGFTASEKTTLKSLPFQKGKSYNRSVADWGAQISGMGPSNQVLVTLSFDTYLGSGKEAAWRSSFTWDKCTSYWVRP